MKTKTLLDVPEFEGKEVVIKKFNYGNKLDLQEDSMTIGLKDGKESAEVSLSKLKTNTIIMGIVSAPFFTMAAKEQRLKELRELDPDTGDFLYMAVQEFNTKSVAPEVKKKLEPSQEGTTLPLTSTEESPSESLTTP